MDLIAVIVGVIMMMKDMASMLRHVMDDEFHAMSSTQHMRQVTFRANDRLPWK